MGTNKDDGEILFENNLKNELDLIYALTGLKPAGASRHFQMISIMEKLQDKMKRPVKSTVVWKYLHKLYDLPALNDIEGMPPIQPEDFDFSKEKEYEEAMKMHLAKRRKQPEEPEPKRTKPPAKIVDKKDTRTPGKSKEPIKKDLAIASIPKSRSATPIVAKNKRKDSTSSVASNLSTSTPRGRSSTPKRRPSTPKDKRETKEKKEEITSGKPPGRTKNNRFSARILDDDSKSKSSDEMITPVKRALRKSTIRGDDGSSSRKRKISPATTTATPPTKRRSRFL